MSTNNELSLKLNLQHKTQALEILAVWSDSVLSEEKTRRSLDLSRRHPSASTCWEKAAHTLKIPPSLSCWCSVLLVSG